ncbi:Unconventional myosin-Va [Phytophthora ramorum]|uniref:Unconventional myosin-Va n=1 Tax=Phytophthora ramorum TaxID=164328 RepID=UPI0030ABF81D|nr:Unconventional myosin-Va [Phytophthora ramorum]
MPPPLLTTKADASSTRGRSFPTPFKCSGDFCGFALQLSQADPVSSHRPGARRAAAPPPQVAAASALSLLFAKEELRALGDANLGRLVAAMEVAQTAGDGKLIESGALRVITYKSIALGRGNREQLHRAVSQLQSSGDASSSPTKPGRRRQSHLLDGTLSQELRKNSRSRVYGEMDGVANYYRQVRVCADCYAVYALLDLARQMAAGPVVEDASALAQQKQQQLKRKQQRMSRQRVSIEDKWEERVAQEVRDKEAILLRKHRDDSKQKTLAQIASSTDTVSTAEDMESSTSLPALANSSNSARSDAGLSKTDSEKSARPQNGSKHAVSMPSLQSPDTSAPPSAMSKTTKSPAHQQKHLLRTNDTLVGMDNYLRGVTKRIEAPSLQEGQLFRRGTGTKRSSTFISPATILLLSSDTTVLDDLHRMLRTLTSPTLELEVESMTNGQQALRAAQDFDYDVVLVERELAAGDMSGLEFARLLRQSQLKRRLKANSTSSATILCVSSQTAPDDLQLYKDSGMDGCIGKPIGMESLQQTLQAALHARKSLSRDRPSSPAKQQGDEEVHTAMVALAQAKQDQQMRQRRRRRRLEASHSLAMPGLAEMDARDDYVHGVFHMDAETAIPFCVMGGARTSVDKRVGPTDPNEAFFNLVVVHDLFDTWERLQILLQPLVARYRGRVQVLLWNYPGQAYTAWRRGTLLHNTYHAACLTALLRHVTGASGSDRLLRDKPYHLVGIGNGGNIAMSFCCSTQPHDANTRSLVLLNSFAHVDAQLAQFLHDTAKVLACTPESRPDLPVYFHARFLFSAAYLARVSTPLALNLYTAVLNPITLEGRQALTLGALAHHDLRTDLRRLRVPLISVCSSQNALVDAGGHAETIVALANLELVDSVGKVLRYRRVKSQQQQHSAGRNKRPSCVVWLPGGHEALQECKQDVLVLLEQLVTGFHELNDVPHGTTRKLQELASGKQNSRCEDEQPPDNQSRKKSKPQRNFEDAFIDRVLTTVKDAVPASSSAVSHHKPLDGAQWRLHQQQIAEQAALESSGATTKSQTAVPVDPHSSSNQRGASKPSKLIALTTLDPTTPAFERISANVVYQPGAGSKIYPLLPEVKEYMGWRVRRNQKRLQRMAAMARVIQRAFRAFYARTLTHRMHRERCAINLQRLWRARVARKRYKGLKREDWAVRLLQRHWRGKMGRTSYKQHMLEYLSALDIQRIARGWLARHRVLRRRQQLHHAAVRIQQLMRRYVACRKLFRQRLQRNAAMNIQRVFRGLLGRRRFTREREKFLFSKTQSQGLTFGKQLLLEYKLYGTKLQSDVALLAREKSDVEAQAEKLVNEICAFDEGIRLLEAELLALGQAETDSNAPGGANRTLDETAKWALREQKMRLDREFSQMLAQIAQRREKLATLEETLARVDQERLRKEEELKALERKLVLLLEEQQSELARIRDKQETRSQLALDLIPSSAMPPGPGSAFASSSGPTTLSPTSSAHSTRGFSQQQRQEAASLMESTETMMKFGFMSMSMTYFSSMNMVRAMRKIGAHHMTLDSAAAVSQQRWPENSAAETSSKAVGGLAAMNFQPGIPPGGFPGQQPLQVAAWSVSDVGRWLDTLALAQYKRAFADATVDGALLLYLTDDDLRNTLGMEHRLHRKKVLTTVEEMRVRERNQMHQLYGDSIGSTVSEVVVAPSSSPIKSVAASAVLNPVPTSSVGPTPASSEAPVGAGRVVVAFSEFCSLVRHGKLKQVREALQDVPERRFDPLVVKTPFVPGSGTVYSDQLEKSVFHVNKGDDNGNSPLLLAAQNNHLKVAQVLLSKGANPDHQNTHGHTAGHYAIAYSFFDLGAWLLDPDKGGGRDDILNENGLAAYDAWTWLSSRPNGVLAALQTPDTDAVEADKALPPADVPLVIRCVVLVMELALVSGGAFLLLLTSAMTGSVARALLTLPGDRLVSVDAVVRVCEVATFGWGLVALVSWFFHRPQREIVRRLTGFGWSNTTSCLLSVLLHSMAIMVLVLWQRGREDEVLVSMANVHAALHRPDGSLATAEILQNLLLAPAKEELFFRGVIVLVALNRLQNARWSALVSSVLFAAIHLVNLRHVDTRYSASYVAFQVAWALLVGLFLALKLAVSGSLLECLVLHAINNIFALSVSKQASVDVSQPLASISVLVALTMYAVAIARQLQLLGRRTRSDKQV